MNGDDDIFDIEPLPTLVESGKVTLLDPEIVGEPFEYTPTLFSEVYTPTITEPVVPPVAPVAAPVVPPLPTGPALTAEEAAFFPEVELTEEGYIAPASIWDQIADLPSDIAEGVSEFFAVEDELSVYDLITKEFPKTHDRRYGASANPADIAEDRAWIIDQLDKQKQGWTWDMSKWTWQWQVASLLFATVMNQQQLEAQKELTKETREFQAEQAQLQREWATGERLGAEAFEAEMAPKPGPAVARPGHVGRKNALK